MAPVAISGLTRAERTPNSPKRLPRIAGVLYLLVGIFGGFAQGFGYPRVYAAGAAAATAGNVIANSELVRIGVVADLIQATVWVFVAMALYQLLKHVHKAVAGAMVVLSAIGISITCLNTIIEFEALQVGTGAASMATFAAVDLNALMLLLVDTHHYGLLTAQIFGALWLAPMEYLAHKSGWFPKALACCPTQSSGGTPGPRWGILRVPAATTSAPASWAHRSSATPCARRANTMRPTAY
jgi:hypothetical protein